MLYTLIILVISVLHVICQYQIPIRFGNLTIYDRPDGRKDVIIHQGIDVGGYGGLSGLTFFERNGTFETSNAGAVLLDGKLYGNNQTLSYHNKGIQMETTYHFGNKTFQGGPGKEGVAIAQFLNHIAQTFFSELEQASKQKPKEKELKLFRRRRRSILENR